jgi:hypothetical protein
LLIGAAGLGCAAGEVTVFVGQRLSDSILPMLRRIELAIAAAGTMRN